ncbi:hypothetical protein B0H11DRAFT_2078220 [Mycena galericulata]|nr:hypothetical protein B0H11DRAFT_2078220 [Mycena galericulata]
MHSRRRFLSFGSYLLQTAMVNGHNIYVDQLGGGLGGNGGPATGAGAEGGSGGIGQGPRIIDSLYTTAEVHVHNHHHYIYFNNLNIVPLLSGGHLVDDSEIKMMIFNLSDRGSEAEPIIKKKTIWIRMVRKITRLFV